MWKQKEKHILNKTTIKFRSAIGRTGKSLKTCQSIDLMCAVNRIAFTLHWSIYFGLINVWVWSLFSVSFAFIFEKSIRVIDSRNKTNVLVSAYLLKSMEEEKVVKWTDVWCDYTDWFRRSELRDSDSSIHSVGNIYVYLSIHSKPWTLAFKCFN